MKCTQDNQILSLHKPTICVFEHNYNFIAQKSSFLIFYAPKTGKFEMAPYLDHLDLI